MSGPADKHGAHPEGIYPGTLLYCVVLGSVYFYVSGFAYARVAAIALPEMLLKLWSSSPVLGGLVVNILTGIATYWLLAAAVGFAIAVAVRHDFVFYGAVATGAFLVLGAASDYDGWQAFVEVGPDFWLALRSDALINDPFGAFSRWFSLPLSAWLWGRWLYAAPRPASTARP